MRIFERGFLLFLRYQAIRLALDPTGYENPFWANRE
jgi:hypothetical protein